MENLITLDEICKSNEFEIKADKNVTHEVIRIIFAILVDNSSKRIFSSLT